MPGIFKNKILLIGGGFILFLLIALLALIAFPQNNTTKPKVAAVNNTPVTLTWWQAFYDESIYKDIITEFKATPGNQNVTINIVNKNYNNDYYKNLITDIASNSGPDIFTLKNDDLPAYQKYMTPISSFTENELNQYKRDFVPLAVRDTMVKDKVYAVTSYVDNLQLYYNTNLLSQASIPLPPTSWKDLDKQLSYLNKKDLSGNFKQSAISLGTGFDSKSEGGNINRFQDILATLIFQNGAQLYDYQTGTSIFGSGSAKTDIKSNLQGDLSNDNATYNAVKFYSDFSDITTNRYSWNDSQKSNVEAFLEGKLAYIIHYSYFKDTINQRNNRLNYGITDLPQLDQDAKKTYGFFFMDGLNRQLATNAENNPKDPVSQKKLQASEDFLKFLTTKSAQSTFAANTNLPSANKYVIQEQLKRNDDLKVFAAGSLYADNYYKPDVQKVERMWGQMMYRVHFEKQPLSDSINQAIQEYNLILSAGPKLNL